MGENRTNRAPKRTHHTFVVIFDRPARRPARNENKVQINAEMQCNATRKSIWTSSIWLFGRCFALFQFISAWNHERRRPRRRRSVCGLLVYGEMNLLAFALPSDICRRFLSDRPTVINIWSKFTSLCQIWAKALDSDQFVCLSAPVWMKVQTCWIHP